MEVGSNKSATFSEDYYYGMQLIFTNGDTAQLKFTYNQYIYDEDEFNGIDTLPMYVSLDFDDFVDYDYFLGEKTGFFPEERRFVGVLTFSPPYEKWADYVAIFARLTFRDDY